MKVSYTIKDIAKALNLSASTVSRALRDSYEISESTKEIVRAYATKVNYKANPVALSLKEQRTNSIGIIVSEIANNFFSQVINGVESVAYNKHYQVIISQTHESATREKLNVEYLSSRAIDGLLITLSSETSDLTHIKHLQERGFPIVFFDRVPVGFEHSYKIIANNKDAAFDAVEAMIEKGCRRIGHLANASALSITADRLDGYYAALKKHNIKLEEDWVQYCQYGGLRQDEVETATRHFASQNLDGIFLSGDKLTTGFIQAAKSLDFEHLSDLPIAGFTNSNVANLFSSNLIAVRQPAFEMGQIATEHLIKLIESKYPITEFETITLPAELVSHEKNQI